MKFWLIQVRWRTTVKSEAERQARRSRWRLARRSASDGISIFASSSGGCYIGIEETYVYTPLEAAYEVSWRGTPEVYREKLEATGTPRRRKRGP